MTTVAAGLATVLLSDGAETLTLLAGADLTDEALATLQERISEAHPEVDIETHRGEQPLYPVLMSAE
jgi:dihydroxyacetone kinase-like predicted kinase